MSDTLTWVKRGRHWLFSDGTVLPVVTGGDGDEDLDDDGDDDSDEDDSDGDDDEGDESGDDATDEIVNRVVERLESQFNSIADRRVNALLREIRDDGDDDEEDDRRSRRKSKPRRSSSDSGDMREARIAGREYLTDAVKTFLSSDEREIAMDLLKAKVIGHVSSGMDPDEAGQRAAEEVARKVKTMRKTYEEATKKRLRRSGALKDRPGQPASSGGKRSPSSAWDTGADKAKKMYGDRIKSA